MLDDTAFRALFSKSPVKRIGRDRFVRNVLYAIGNSGDAALIPSIERRLAEPAPVVRGAAIWALSRLTDAAAFQTLADRHLPTEEDASVRDEWTRPATAGTVG